MATLSSNINNKRVITISILFAIHTIVILGGGGNGIVANKIAVAVVEAAVVVEGNWCVARSDASDQALQTALDYACGAGADCTPLQTNGLCFLPNTVQAHASYAFNSYFQRKAMAPGSCDFSGTATVARTEPSYGSCVYPASLSTAGGTATSSTPTTASTNNPTSITPPQSTTPTSVDGTTGLNPGTTPPLPTDNSKAFQGSMIPMILMPASFLLVLLVTCEL